MSLSGINMRLARSRVANPEPNGKLAGGSDNVRSASSLVNRISLLANWLKLHDLRHGGPRGPGMRLSCKLARTPATTRARGLHDRCSVSRCAQETLGLRQRGRELQLFYSDFPLTAAALPRFSCRKHCVLRWRVVSNWFCVCVLRTDFVVVRRSVGAPTAHACPGNGSHHPENISAGRGGPFGEFSRPHLGKASGCRCGGSAFEEPLWLDPRNPLSRPDLVRRAGNPGVGAYPASGIAGVA